jgi:hypothetical protein
MSINMFQQICLIALRAAPAVYAGSIEVPSRSWGQVFLWDGHVGKIPGGFIVVAFPAVIAIIINEAYKSG